MTIGSLFSGAGMLDQAVVGVFGGSVVWHRHAMPASTGQGGTWANRTEVLWSNRPLNDHPALFGTTP